MRRLTRFDLVLLATFVAIYAVILTLHLREARRTGLQQPPIFATVAPGPYPIVGGLRIERGGAYGELRLGDRLLRVGESDLAGVGYAGFEARALAAAGAEDRATLVYERDGVVRETELVMKRAALPWYRLPFMVSFIGVAILFLLRVPRRLDARLAFVGFAGFAIFETPFYGSSVAQSLAHSVVFHVFGPLSLGLLMAALTRIPPEVPDEDRASRHWGWIGLLFPIVRIPYFLGGPIPPQWTPTVVLLCDALFLLTGIGIVAWNTAHASPIGRRRVKWVLLGVVLGGTPLALTMSLQGFFDDPDRYTQVFQYSALAAVLAPLGFLVAIARENLYDIDRLISSAATYSLSLVGLVAAGIAIVAPAARAVAEATGVHADLALVAAAGAIAAVAIPVGTRLRPWVDRVFFPERVALERGIRLLLVDLSDCDSADQVFELVQARLASLLRVDPCGVLVRDGDRLVRRDAPRAPALDAHGALAEALASDPAPRSPEAWRSRFPDLTRDELSAIADEDTQILLPIRAGKDLAGIVSIGRKRSGDLFPPTELTLLGAVAEKASAELVRLRATERASSEFERAEELHALKEAAEEANHAKSRFLAAASHDLRQPLHALGLFVERLASEAADPSRTPSVELVSQIRRSTEALTSQFDALLDLSRLDAGGVVPTVGAFALAPELERLAAEFREAAAAKGLRLRFECDDLRVESDPALIVRIVQNLLANAVRYTERGEIVLSARAASDAAVIEVSDTGPGIPPERQREVFGEFVQLDRDRGGDGLGLGLSIVQRTADLLGHRVELDSTPGAGCRFRLHLPLAATRTPALAVLREAPARPFAGRRVLLVEDEPSVLEALAGLLRSWGCDVIPAERGGDVLERLDADEPPELIIADYRLAADETGLDVIDHVRGASGASVPAVVVSGESSAESLERIRASGLPYLAKPVRPAKLRALLAELLRQDQTVH